MGPRYDIVQISYLLNVIYLMFVYSIEWVSMMYLAKEKRIKKKKKKIDWTNLVTLFASIALVATLRSLVPNPSTVALAVSRSNNASLSEFSLLNYG